MAPGGPIIDSNLLAQIQTLTNQLLSKTEAKSEPEGFNTVSKNFGPISLTTDQRYLGH